MVNIIVDSQLFESQISTANLLVNHEKKKRQTFWTIEKKL